MPSFTSKDSRIWDRQTMFFEYSTLSRFGTILAYTFSKRDICKIWQLLVIFQKEKYLVMPRFQFWSLHFSRSYTIKMHNLYLQVAMTENLFDSLLTFLEAHMNRDKTESLPNTFDHVQSDIVGGCQQLSPESRHTGYWSPAVRFDSNIFENKIIYGETWGKILLHGL